MAVLLFAALLAAVTCLLSAVDMLAGSMGVGTSFQVSFGTAVLAVSVLAMLGLAAGLAPALRAMAVKPVDSRPMNSGSPRRRR